jgi:lipoprotein NlpD
MEVKQEKPSATKDITKPSDRMNEEKLARNEPRVERSSNEPVADPGIKLSWPSKGNVIDRFDEGKNKGIDISGNSGDPIQAAADGKVVYAGNSLRGYGNLLIVKHDNTYLTAYAHNKTLLVKEGDTVKKGQKIAEMGNTDADQVKLHFEVRKHGKPVDPMSFLP